MKSYLKSIYIWSKNDFKTNPFRFCAEILAWLLSVTCSITLTITTPHPPLKILYPLWVANCMIFAWASWTRGSFAMLTNYLLLSTIDLIGLVKTFLMI